MTKSIRYVLLTIFTSVLASALLVPTPAQAQCGARLLGFYTYYNGAYRSNKIPYTELTHIAHAFLDVSSNGNITVPGGYLEPALIANAHANGVKVLTSIGGANVTNFSGVAANPAYTTNFVNQLYQFIHDNGYDGVDIDWEFPQGSADLANEVGFFSAIRNKFNSSPSPAPSWEISFDVEANGFWGQWVDYTNLIPYVSYFNSMSYGNSGSWVGHTSHNCPISLGTDPYVDGTDQADMDYLITSRSVPPSKINLGMPFYGVEFPFVSGGLYATCGNCSGISNPNYSQIPTMFASWTYNWDAAAQVPYYVGPGNTGFLTFENSQSVTVKVNYALGTRKVGGVFMWELSSDYMSNNTQPLLDSMYSAFIANAVPTCTPTITPTPIPTATPYVVDALPPPVIYPNPVTVGGTLNLQLPMSGPSDVKLQIFTISFRKIQEVSYSQLNPGGVCRCVTIPVTIADNWGNDLSNGLYYMVETTTDGVFTQKLLILR